MKKITLLFAFVISASVFVSCADGNAAATGKINKSNLKLLARRISKYLVNSSF